MSGAGSGLFDPKKEAEKLGEWNYGTLFTYLYRRFGPPLQECDIYKKVAQYILTTDMQGVFLLVYPCPSGFSFGYGLSTRMDKACHKEDYKPIAARNKRFDRWRKKNGVPSLFDIFRDEPYSENEWEEITTEWHKIHPEYAGIEVTEKEREEFFKWSDERMTHYLQEFSKNDPPYPNRYPRVYIPGSLMDRINNALIAALKELLVPTYVRDVYINALGIVPDPHEGDKTVEYYSK